MNHDDITKKVKQYNSKRLLMGKRPCCYLSNEKAYYDIGRADCTNVVIPDFVYGIENTTEKLYIKLNDSIVETVEFGDNIKFIGEGTFYGFDRLRYVSDMDGLTDIKRMVDTFKFCSSLVKPPKLPENVVILDSSFAYCHSLEKAPNIPNNATSMDWMFENCHKLKEFGKIPESMQKMKGTFRNCKLLKNAPVITKKVTEMCGTFQGCISLENAPVIPENVDDITELFWDCNKLSGDVIIHTDTNKYIDCLYGTVLPIRLIGNSIRLDEISETSRDGNVKVGMYW